MPLYNIVRFYASGESRTVKSCVELKEAQSHCSDPESSSLTCTNARAKKRTAERGHWFDGYVEFRPRRRRDYR